MPIFIKHVEGSKTGQIESFDQDRIRIGRQADNDVKFDPKVDASVSGYHAEIYQEDEVFFIKDLQSRNGTLVNSRKIDQPVRLKEGDLVQFSSRGPKVAFSTQDPSGQSGTGVLDAPASASTVVSPAVEKAQPEKQSNKWAMLVPAAVVGISLVALVGAGLYLGYSWWVLLIVVAVALLVVGGLYIGWRFWKRRRALREQEEAARQEREVSLGRGDKDNLQDIKRKWLEVVRSLRESKFHKLGDDAVSALPWFMLLGEPGCGKSGLVKAGGPLSSVLSQGQAGPTRNCDWWFFDKLVVLDLSGRYVFQTKDSDSASEWQALLNLVKTNRRQEPINGVIVAVAADSLASRPVEKLKEQAAQIRERLDEMVQRLGVKFPVYLAVSKGDLIAGFNEFWSDLPDQVKGQALGYVNSDAVNNSDASRFFDKAFRTICERAERVRLGMMFEERQEQAAHGMFLFPAELKSLQVPLKSFVDVLFRPSPYRDAPFFRGLFLASGRQAGTAISRLSRLLGFNYAHGEPKGTSRDLFSRDLYSVILPNDRAMAGRTALGRERYQLTRAAGLIAAVASSFLLCGLFTLSFTNNWLALSRLDLAPCMNMATSSTSIGETLRPLDGCRQNIETLSPQSIWKKFATNFGLRQTHRLASALQERFLTAFRTGVLTPLDTRIDQILATGSSGSLIVGSVIQRIQLLTRCQENDGCTDLEKPDGVSYRVMLAVADPQLKEGDPAIERLRRTHGSYLLWQADPKVFAEMRAKDLERIKDWIRRGGLQEEAVLESAKAQFPAIRAANFSGGSSPLEVHAAYTARAWREGIEPLISGLQKMAADQADVSESVKKFEANYRTQALRQWGDFLTGFPDAEKMALQRSVSRELALNVSGADSPYNRVIDSANANLSVILGSAWQGSDLPPWAAMLKQYVALRGKALQAQKTGKPDEKAQGKESEALGYLAIYLDALSQLRTELSTTEKSFKSSQKAFEEGEPSSKAAHPILRASWALSMLRGSIGSPQDADRLFWILLARPISLAWRAMLDESGKYLQQQWEGLLLEVRDLEPGPKGGKIIAFVNGSAAAFLARQGGRWAPRRLLDQSVPFTDAFVQYLSRLRLDAMNSSAAQPSPGAEPPFNIVRSS